ncbi:hypothetical protein, partial [Micromonospora wenchangensis]|uniref:hypothetical protein n=1 Tax=Micromonospora wenchangensis TaxID=1185415 RepID=UPI003D748799
AQHLQMTRIAPALDAVAKAQQAQLRLTLGLLRTKNLSQVAMTSLQSRDALVVDGALADLECAVEEAGAQFGPEGASLLIVWAESLRDFRSWLLQPAAKWPAISVVSFLISYWWVTLKTEHPDVADMVEVPFSILAGCLIAMAANARKK